MKFQYLGTAAAEGCPAVFCNCDYCKQAREIGGKNIRTRSQAIINDDLVLDFPPDSLAHFQAQGIRGDKIKYVVFTHSHSDHYYATDLLRHGTYYAHNMEQDVLHIICSETLYERMQRDLANVKKGVNLEYHVAKAFEPIQLEGYELIPLPARHAPNEKALFYIIRAEGKTLLYAHDTGYFYDEVFDYIRENKIVFDMISLDCTNGHITKEGGNHMGLMVDKKVADKLREIGAVNEKTIQYVNHFSHNGNPVHEVITESAAALGFAVSYDGLKLEI